MRTTGSTPLDPRKPEYVVVGNPIAHSRSPEIHQAFARQFGRTISYERVLLEKGQLPGFADDFFAQGGLGMNVTVPFKVEAYDYAASTDPMATAAHAVNTLAASTSGGPKGYNTDGIGLCADLEQRYGVKLAGAKIVILGAGGATAGVIQPLLAANPQALIIANRTLSTAQHLVALHTSPSGMRTDLHACGLDQLSGDFDLVINATSIGLSGVNIEFDPGLVSGAFCYDMSYGRAATFAGWASANGASESVDGLGMLVEQAAQSFFLWTGLRPETNPVCAQLRSAV